MKATSNLTERNIGIPLISVVIPVRNRCDITLRVLARITRQTHPNLLIIVIDSCSTDGTAEAIKSKYPDVCLISADPNDYWAGATNRGVQLGLAAGSEWILTINDDSLVDLDYIERLLVIACANDCQILGSQINYLANPKQVWSLGTQANWGCQDFLSLRFNGTHIKDLPLRILSQEVISVDALPGNGVMINCNVFKSIGLYNKRFLPHYHADSEFVMRAINAGFKAWVTPRVTLFNDFSVDQKKLPFDSFKGLKWIFCNPKSYLYAPPLIYIYIRYCPLDKKIQTLFALILRLLKIAK